MAVLRKVLQRLADDHQAAMNEEALSPSVNTNRIIQSASRIAQLEELEIAMRRELDRQ